jgi:hypothetical protein
MTATVGTFSLTWNTNHISLLCTTKRNTNYSYCCYCCCCLFILKSLAMWDHHLADWLFYDKINILRVASVTELRRTNPKMHYLWVWKGVSFLLFTVQLIHSNGARLHARVRHYHT